MQKLGWNGAGTQFDFLPMVLSGKRGKPKYYSVPDHLCMRVKIEHPSNEGITGMGLEWLGLPGESVPVANLHIKLKKLKKLK